VGAVKRLYGLMTEILCQCGEETESYELEEENNPLYAVIAKERERAVLRTPRPRKGGKAKT